MATTPIIDSQTGKTLAQSSIVDRAPSVLAQELEPRPDFFVPVTTEIADRLGLETTDLIAVQASTDARTGEIVIARVGERGHMTCGELHRRDEGIAELRSITSEGAAASIVTKRGLRRPAHRGRRHRDGDIPAAVGDSLAGGQSRAEPRSSSLHRTIVTVRATACVPIPTAARNGAPVRHTCDGARSQDGSERP